MSLTGNSPNPASGAAPATQPADSREIAVCYETTSITRIREFVVSATHEDVVLDCSSGTVPGEQGDPRLPIHLRLGLSWSAVEHLAEILQRLQRERQLQLARQLPGHPAGDDPGRPPRQPALHAAIPRMDGPHD